MYKNYCGKYVGDCVLQKSVRIDKDTYDIIMGVSSYGTFSDNVRRMAHEYRQLKSESPGKK